MALCIDKEINTGVITTYHRVGKITIDWKAKECVIKLEMYLNKEARDNGKNCLETETFAYNGDKFDFDPTISLVEQLYSKIKIESDWSNATDC